jgi:hypothetical protein
MGHKKFCKCFEDMFWAANQLNRYFVRKIFFEVDKHRNNVYYRFSKKTLRQKNEVV